MDTSNKGNTLIEQCIFCGCANTKPTKEHVFGEWVLKAKTLHNQRLNLIDGSSIPYRQLTIPICSRCNNETLSGIEDRIKAGVATETEYYLWALKIYIGILYKESLLTSYKYGKNLKIISRDGIESDISLVKQVFKVYQNKGAFLPGLPGSVIRIPRKSKEAYFDYVDILDVPIIGVALPKEYVIAVLFDKGRAYTKTDQNKLLNLNLDSTEFRFLVADYGYDEYRLQRGFSWMSIEDSLLMSPGGLCNFHQKPFDENEFIGFLRAVKIEGQKDGNKWKIWAKE
jgi:hypothetical protein